MTISQHGIHYLEIVTLDAEAACDHYSQAYGWQFTVAAATSGNVYVAPIPGGSLCGIRESMLAAEQPTVRTYIRVDNIKSAIQKAVDLGAVVAVEPMEISGHGLIAIYLFGGIEQGIWQVP